MNTDNLRDDGNDPSRRWARAAANLRTYREAPRARLGDVDEGVLTRFIAGSATEDERERILRAMLINHDLRECIDVVRDALSVRVSPSRHFVGAVSRDQAALLLPGLPELLRRVLPPRSVPELRGYRFFASSRTADELGGDYYDFISLSADRVAIILADVFGKGVPVALRLAKFSSEVRHCLLTAQTPALALESLNRLQCETGREAEFVTLSVGVLDRATNRLTLCSAGSLPMLLRRADGRIEQIGEGIAGFPLGIVPESKYEQTEVELRPGDVVFAYSDGITDSYNPRGESFGGSRLARLLSELTGGPEVIGQAIQQDIYNFLDSRPLADDITLICFGPHP
jgi:serine phosphatase RsbU (regulator of sigma subunit)